jgi:hypothetical protein
LKKKVYATLKAIFKPRPIVLREINQSELVVVANDSNGTF